MNERPIHVLVVANVLYPDLAGGAAVFSDLCFSLARRGFKVTALAPYPFYPEWRDKTGRNGVKVWRYRENGVTFARYGLYIPRSPNSLVQRVVFEASFFLSLLRALPAARKCDVMLAFCPLASGVAFAGLAKHLFSKPVWLNVQDISADAAAAVGIAKAGVVSRLLRGTERLLFNQADVWSSISPVMVERLKEVRRRGQTIHMLPNWVGDALRREIEALPSKIGRPPSRPLRLLYAGNIGKKQNLLAFCRTVRRARGAFEFRIFGNGANAAEVEEFVRTTGDSRFSFGPFLPEKDFAQELWWADYYVITESPGIGGSFIPSKLIPGLMSGTPLLTVCDRESPLGQEMAASQAGPFFSWDRVDEVIDLLDCPSSREFDTWQRNAIARARVYDREAIIAAFEEGLRSLALAT